MYLSRTIQLFEQVENLAHHNVNPCPAEVIYLNFQPLEVVSRYRYPQPEVVENTHICLI